MDGVPSPVTLRDLAERHRLFLVDQFGVLHDGAAPYPGAVEALVRLKQAGGGVVLLSNSGKRARENEARLVGLGFARNSWDLFLTSGEIAHGLIRAGSLPGLSSPPRTCLVIARGGDRSVIAETNVRAVDEADGADFVLIAGSDAPAVTLDDYRRQLEPAARRNLPAVCTNPDMDMLVAGGLADGPGRIASAYEAMGGSVAYIGKPHALIYQTAFARMNLPPQAAIGIGDSIEHDIVGAKSAGAAAALVRTGILAHASSDDLQYLMARFDTRPDAVIRSFAW